jgi:hypothetical protein
MHWLELEKRAGVADRRGAEPGDDKYERASLFVPGVGVDVRSRGCRRNARRPERGC